MKALARDDRTLNIGPDQRALTRCRACDDNGWVTTQTRADTWRGHTSETDEMAPCPFCERGYRQEFPAIPQDAEKAKAWIRPPWGDQGYWKGRDLPDDLVSDWIAKGKPQRQLTPAEQLAQIRQLAARINLGSMDDLPDQEPVAPPAGDPLTRLRDAEPDEAWFNRQSEPVFDRANPEPQEAA